MNGARVLLLAAGRGLRAGGPKAWRPFDGRTLLEAHLDFFRSLVGPSRLAVSIQDGWRGRCASLSPETVWVAADPEAAPLDSLQRLIAAAPPARSFVLHVDMPVFDKAVYEALWRADAEVAVPTFEARRGHPVLLSAGALGEVAWLDAKKDRLDSWMRGRALEVPAPSSSILMNLNGVEA